MWYELEATFGSRLRMSPLEPELFLNRLRSVGAGDSLGGRLVLVRQVGAGSMGRVFEATDPDNGRTLAVKLIQDVRGESDLERFAAEAEILESLDHPAIVAYVGHGTTSEGNHYLAMAWLNGEDLGRRLGRGELSVKETVALGRRIADGLAAAHRAGVIHRDLKPSNIVLVDGDVARATLVDFGVARRSGIAGMTRTGELLGTPGYMAPEQVRGRRDVDGRADLFSLGCVLYQCLVGRPPFGDDEIMTVLARLLLEEAPPVRPARVDVPARLEHLIAQLLTKDDAGRPTSAEVVRDELAAIEDALVLGREDALASPIATASVVRPAAAAVTSPRRRRIIYMCLAAAAVAAVVIGLFFRSRSGRRDPLEERLSLACETGVALACARLGAEYAGDDGVLPADPGAAFASSRRACDLGNRDGCLILAELHRTGVGTPVDPATARRILDSACARGDRRACADLSRLLGRVE